MPFDLVAWYESQDTSSGQLVSAVDVGESIYKTSDDDIIVKKRAPWLGGILPLALSTPKYIEVRQPSLKIPYRFSRAELLKSDKYLEGYYHMWDRPLPLYAGEKMNIYAYNASTEITMVIAWLLSGKCTRAMIEAAMPTHVIRGESTTAAVADAWTNIKTITWSHSLPKGQYAIVGMSGTTYYATHANMTLGACRLVIPDTTWRPGVILNKTIGDQTLHTQAEYSYAAGNLWPVMNEISFPHDDLPTAEVLAAYANSKHMIELLLQKIA